MANLAPSDFPDFFAAVYGHGPFRWQQMLLEKVATGPWPDLVDLPTASGKTACLDIAVFALALQADTASGKRTARRRIFFVVDRRIVVDEAFARANKLARKLDEAESGVLKTVADRLRLLAGGQLPLAVAKLRGGIARTRQTWSEDPAQPAVITATVDQLGSRLLFRSYGGSPLVAPVHAALAAYDSLIILDEAHCSRPFMQTVGAVRNYLSAEKWSRAKINLAPPLQLMVMSATAEKETSGDQPLDIFPAPADRAAALADELLQKRAAATKTARLELIAKGGPDAMPKRAAELAGKQVEKNCQRVAVMVNRVKPAHDIAATLELKKNTAKPPHDVVLITGQMRPIDRDDLVGKWSPFLKASNPQTPARPIIVVTTQCLEVGADFSFDSLITQCSSIDSLLQRFGRLNRLGTGGASEAFILATKDDIRAGADDPVYGQAIANTWQWLSDCAKDSPELGTVNFSINALGDKIRAVAAANLSPLLAPHSDAPTLMPAHVDVLCQTAPHPMPDIDVPAYLHGVGRGEPQVRVAFRADLGTAAASAGSDNPGPIGCEVLELLPPRQAECLNVSISRLKKYLRDEKSDAAAEDVEGSSAPELAPEDEKANTQPFFRRRDGMWTFASAFGSLVDIRPGDTVVIPVRSDETISSGLGTNLDGAPIDRAEEAVWLATLATDAVGKTGFFLRISESVLSQSALQAISGPLLEWRKQAAAASGDGEEPDLGDLRAALIETAKQGDAAAAPAAKRLAEICKAAAPAVKRGRVAPHPAEAGAWIVTIPGRQSDPDDTADEDAGSQSDAPALLIDHLEDVRGQAKKFAPLIPADFHAMLDSAAQWHDLGKLDPRFQEKLGGGAGEPLAKSGTYSGNKVDFRHEMISLQIIEKCFARQLPADEIQRGLLLHLIAAHHGHARPFAPYRKDSAPMDIQSPRNFDPAISLPAAMRDQMPAAHHLGSGIPDRFWYLTRHFGWWGLAYLESMLRMADWAASANPTVRDQEPVEVAK